MPEKKGKNEIQNATKKHKSSLLSQCHAPNEQIVVPQCRICSLDFREEVESEYEKKRNYSHIKRFLAGRGVEITIRSISRHINNHYLPTIEKEKLSVYAADLPKFLEAEQDYRTQLRERIWILNKHLYDIVSDDGNTTLDDKIKMSGAMKNISDAIGVLEGKLSEIDMLLEPAEMVIIKIGNIIGEKIKASKDEASKKLLYEVLEELKESTDELFVEDK